MPTRFRPVAVLWRRLDRPGHESARLVQLEEGWRLSGLAVFRQENEPCALRYRIDCDRAWNTRSATVTGWLGGDDVLVRVEVGHSGHWVVDGAAAAQIEGCVDIDLNFSPSTNVLPIRRLSLPIGGEATVRAAWLRFPTFRMELLEQTYRRISENRYHYSSAGGRFQRELEVDTLGFVTSYPDFWRREDG
jgi:hypothetical protein